MTSSQLLPSGWWARGLGAAEAGGDRLEWAELVERVVAAAPGHAGRAPDPDAPWAHTLALPLRPFVDAFRAAVSANAVAANAFSTVDANVSGAVSAADAGNASGTIGNAAGAANASGSVDLDRVLDGMCGRLARRLVRIAVRVLVLELNVARVQMRLVGDTARERFADFARQLCAGPALAALFVEYPVLGRLLAQATARAAEATTELLRRFVADRGAIVDGLLGGVDPGALVAVDLGAGDTHAGGRSVAVLRFDGGGAVVYKPRPLQLHAWFGEVVGWLGTLLPELSPRIPDCLPREGYGWTGFVEHRPCASAAEVDAFYRRQGVLLALLHALDGSDVHYENVIACGDQPVLVDVETLFHPPSSQPRSAPDPAADALERSVARIALLPRLMIGEHGALDISGLGGDRGVKAPDSVVGWSGAGTDEMRLVRVPVEFRGGVNRPTLDGRDIDPGEYRAALLGGFRAGYDAIVDGQAELSALLRRCAGAPIRVVVRATRIYATILDESTHPDLMRDGRDHERMFDVLAAGAGAALADEVADLWNGDVPMFTGRPGSTSVWSARGVELPGFLDRTGLDRVAGKLSELGAVSRREQEWLITAALTTRTGPVDHRGTVTVPDDRPAAPPDPQRLLAVSCGIADDIVMRALHGGGRANWLGLELADERHWAVLPMGASLASGYCGVALFLAQLAAVSGTGRYAQLAHRALRPLPSLFEQLAAEPELVEVVGPGAFLGLGGVCYALARTSTLLGDEIPRLLPRAVEVMALSDGPSPDLATGWAGGLATMIAVHAETGLPAAKDLAERYAGLLSTVDLSAVGPGFTRGLTGIRWALARHGIPTTPAPVETVDAATAAGGPDYGWCGGLAGEVLGGSTAAAVADPLVKRRPLRDQSLCHGELGVIEALGALAARGDERAAAATRRCTAHVVGAIDQQGPHCGTPGGVPTPGLVSGLAGIGYALLRIGFPEQVPSILTLESRY